MNEVLGSNCSAAKKLKKQITGLCLRKKKWNQFLEEEFNGL
jgi:hypothetical protein